MACPAAAQTHKLEISSPTSPTSSDDDDYQPGEDHCGGDDGDALESGDDVETEEVEGLELPPPPPVKDRECKVDGIKWSVPYKAPRQYTGGRVRALLIGINYGGRFGKQLKGCVNDVRTMVNALKAVEFPIQECCILVDKPDFPGFSDMPTRANMLKYMKWLVSDVRPGDVLFFHYSGHGGQAKARGDKHEKLDQTICPLDYKKKGAIRDNDLFKILVAPLPEGVRMTCTFDSCHSQTILDLPFGAASSADGTRQQLFSMRPNNFSRGDVVMFSGCRDRQSCSDVRGKHGANGAGTHGFSSGLKVSHCVSYGSVIENVRAVLKKRKMKQIPYLQASKPIDLEQPFSLFGTFKLDQKMLMEKVPAKWRCECPEETHYHPQPGDKCGTPPAYCPPPKLPIAEPNGDTVCTPGSGNQLPPHPVAPSAPPPLGYPQGPPVYTSGPPAQPGYPTYGNTPPAQPGYPAYGNNPPAQPGYPAYGNNPPAQPGYPAYGNNPPAQPGYPAYGNNPPAQPGYPAYGNNPPAQPGYPAYNGGAAPPPPSGAPPQPAPRPQKPKPKPQQQQQNDPGVNIQQAASGFASCVRTFFRYEKKARRMKRMMGL